MEIIEVILCFLMMYDNFCIEILRVIRKIFRNWFLKKNGNLLSVRVFWFLLFKKEIFLFIKVILKIINF